MKSNQKGFTLIELLAVIVILAIIALIATPLVLNIIAKARTSAAQDSVYGAMESTRLVFTESLLDPTAMALPVCVDFQAKTIKYGTDTNGAECANTYMDPANSAKNAWLTAGGTLPSEGTIKLKTDGKFEAVEGIKVNGITCSIQENQEVKCS